MCLLFLYGRGLQKEISEGTVLKKNSKKARDAIYGNEQRGAEDDAAFAKPQQEKYYTERRQGQKAKRRPVKLKIGN